MKVKAAILLAFVVFLSACVSPTNSAFNPFSPSFNPFNIFQQPARQSEGLQVKLYAVPDPVFRGSDAVIYFDAQNRDVTQVRNVLLDIFDTGNLVRKGDCRLGADSLRPDQIISLTCRANAPEDVIKKVQAETINARAGFRSVLSAVQTVDIMSEKVYNREALAGNIKPRPKTYAYRDKNVEMTVEFSEDMPIVVRKDKQYFVYFTVRNIGNGFMDKITFGENFLPIEQKDLRFSESKSALTSANIVEIFTSLFRMTPGQEKEGLSCRDVLCCRDFKTIYPTGKTFPRIACELRLPDTEQLVDYQIIVPLIYDYEVRASARINVVK